VKAVPPVDGIRWVPGAHQPRVTRHDPTSVRTTWLSAVAIRN